MPVRATEAHPPAPTAAHGAAIVQLAITDDGRAAVTQDAMGGTRLWPTLDGRNEPILLRTVPATQLVIGRDAAGFVVAALDEVGGAELLHVAASGSVLSRVRVAPDPAIESIAMGPQGVLAIRADQTLAILSATGEVVARLGAPPRSRMKHVATANGRTLVVFAHDESMYGRWVTGTAWGATTRDFMIDPQSRAMLSPNGKLLLIDFEFATSLLELETGHIVAKYRGVPIGFADDATVVVLDVLNVVWQPIGGGYGSERIETEDAREPMVVAGGIAFAAQGASIVLHARDRVQQLGYAIGDAGGMHALGSRVVVTGVAEAVLLDDSLEQSTAFALPADSRALFDLVPIDDQFVITVHIFPAGGGWAMSVIDVAHQETQQTMTVMLARGDLRYESSTQLLEVTDSNATYLTKWDDKKHSFETWYALAGGVADLHVVDPRLNDGVVAIALRSMPNGKVEISEIDGADLKVGAPIEPRHRYLVDGYPLGVDRLGTVYARAGEMVRYRHGVEVGRIAHADGPLLAIHPGGAYIARYGDQRIHLYDAVGTLQWTIAAPLARRIAWLGNDLVVSYLGGLGKIDAATGALIKRTCGWSFGLRALSKNDQLAGDSICDAQ
jgi:hypothetical protein